MRGICSVLLFMPGLKQWLARLLAQDTQFLFANFKNEKRFSYHFRTYTYAARPRTSSVSSTIHPAPLSLEQHVTITRRRSIGYLKFKIFQSKKDLNITELSILLL